MKKNVPNRHSVVESSCDVIRVNGDADDGILINKYKSENW